MNKASRFDEWLDAMRMNALPMFNAAYADREGHVFYVYNARLPLRAEGYDWAGIVPGNTSRTLWTESLPFDRLPQVKDPAFRVRPELQQLAVPDDGRGRATRTRRRTRPPSASRRG